MSGTRPRMQINSSSCNGGKYNDQISFIKQA